MDKDKINDTDYKLFQAIIKASKLATEQADLNFNEKQRFEIILFLYMYSFNRIYDLKPEFERLIWKNVQCKVFMFLINYATKIGLDKYINDNVGDFINSRAKLYDSEIEKMNSKDNQLPAKLLHTIFESPLTVNPKESYNSTNYLVFQTIQREPINHLNRVAKNIIQIDYNFGNSLKYKQIIKDYEDQYLNVNIDALKIVFTNSEQCKKIYHPSYLSGLFPRGREFFKAVSSVEKIKNADTLLIGAFLLFENWIKTYKERYGVNSIPNEQLLLIEHQIIQSYKQIIS